MINNNISEYPLIYTYITESEERDINKLVKDFNPIKIKRSDNLPTVVKSIKIKKGKLVFIPIDKNEFK